jgi:hypothetical protein
MSRRIAFAILATAATLICAPAHADRECFENSCRMPEVVDPPLPAVPAPSGHTNLESTQATPEARSPEVIRPRAPTRRDLASQNASDDRPAKARSAPSSTPSSADPRKAEAAFGASTPAPLISARARPRDIPPPRMVDQPRPGALLPPPRRVDVARRLPARSAHSDRLFRGRVRPIIGSAPYVSAPYDVIDLPDTIDAYDGVVAAYPDLSWKLCQISEAGVVLPYYYCGPYDYHPYGAHGYRPLGTYHPYRSTAPAYVVVPNAKIIVLDRD